MLLGADGVSLEEGLTTPSIGVATVEKAMLRQTRGEVLVLADSSKIGVVADVAICPLDRADLVIVDDGNRRRRAGGVETTRPAGRRRMSANRSGRGPARRVPGVRRARALV